MWNAVGGWRVCARAWTCRLPVHLPNFTFCNQSSISVTTHCSVRIAWSVLLEPCERVPSDMAHALSHYKNCVLLYKPSTCGGYKKETDEKNVRKRSTSASSTHLYVFFFLCDFFGGAAGVGDLDSLISSSFCTSSSPRFCEFHQTHESFSSRYKRMRHVPCPFPWTCPPAVRAPPPPSRSCLATYCTSAATPASTDS